MAWHDELRCTRHLANALVAAKDASGVLMISQSTGSPHTASIAKDLEADSLIAIPLTWYSGWADPTFGKNVFGDFFWRYLRKEFWLYAAHLGIEFGAHVFGHIRPLHEWFHATHSHLTRGICMDLWGRAAEDVPAPPYRATGTPC